MIPRFKKPQKFTDNRLKKEEFLVEHNRLSPESFRVTSAMLSSFRTEKASLFKDDYWSIEKLRRPLIIWLSSLSAEKKES